MKAILVVDMPDNLENYLDKIKVFYAIGTLNGQELFHRFNQPLKPMPMKMRTDEDDIEEDSYWQGWNACLEELEK